MCLEAYGELKFLPNIYTRQIKSGRLRGKAAIDQKLQITHQNPTNLAENTNLKRRVEGTQTQTYFSGKQVLEFKLAGCQNIKSPQ